MSEMKQKDKQAGCREILLMIKLSASVQYPAGKHIADRVGRQNCRQNCTSRFSCFQCFCRTTQAVFGLSLSLTDLIVGNSKMV